MKRYGLIEDDDRILVALSGGKDSMALLELLAQRSHILKPRFSLEAAHVRMTNIPYHSDEAYLHEFADSLGVPLHVFETSFDESTDQRHTHCFLCSWNRRKVLFNEAQRLGFNKIALGHNQDDIIQTALMNLSFQSTFSAMTPKLRMRKFPITLIRPLCLVREHDLEAFARKRGYHKQLQNCPYEDASHRADMKAIIARLEEMNPEFASSCFAAIDKTFGSQDQGTVL